MKSNHFDYIIVGAGSAGCVLANRLSADNRHRVCVIEYGGSDIGPLIQMPAALSYPMNMSLYDWGYSTEPEQHLGNRVMACPRGKVMGGSSSINGMVYVRGHPGDFDQWEALGATGWSHADVAPYFKRLENAVDSPERGAWRGDNGPLYVTRGRRQNPLYRTFVEAGQQAGFPVTNDYNGHQQEGFGDMEQTTWQGRRWSAANAYLSGNVKKRPNLTIKRGLANRVLFTNKQASAVEYNSGNRRHQITAEKGIILSASSINSPQLLMLSGIGDKRQLSQHAIDCIADRPGVGKNLQDHLEMYVQYTCRQPITLYSELGLLAKARIGLTWLLFKKGLGSTNHFEAAAFLRSAAGVRYPDIQYHFLPVAIRYDGRAAAADHGFQAHVGPMRSPSRGSIELASAHPKQAPKIKFNYMSSEKDWQDFRYCIRLTREIFHQKAFAPYVGRELLPGTQAQSDAALDDAIRENVESAYHPCGSCRMGQDTDSEAVVDPFCRVIGVNHLYVVDSSIFPTITNGNLNGPTLMVAEKAADHILGNNLLPRHQEIPWINPNWQDSDR